MTGTPLWKGQRVRRVGFDALGMPVGAEGTVEEVRWDPHRRVKVDGRWGDAGNFELVSESSPVYGAMDLLPAEFQPGDVLPSGSLIEAVGQEFYGSVLVKIKNYAKPTAFTADLHYSITRPDPYPKVAPDAKWEALLLCAEALEEHEQWCGFNRHASGAPIFERAITALRAVLSDESTP